MDIKEADLIFLAKEDMTSVYELDDMKDLQKETDIGLSGAVIMNCNPFTKGHRYLIERALEKVNRLYLCVIPSGKYILSKDTFAQYFEKENMQIVEDMDYDIRIFGEKGLARNRKALSDKFGSIFKKVV